MKRLLTSILVGVLASCNFALGQPPKPPWQPLWPETQGAANAQDDSDNDVGRSEEPPFLVRIQKTEEETANEKNDRAERSSAASDAFRIGWFTFAILLIQAGVFMYQGRQLRATVKEMAVTTVATKKAAAAARKSAAIAEATLEATNRPWLMVTKTAIDPTENGPLIRNNLFYMPVNVAIKNIGYSPAVNIKTFVFTLFDFKGEKNIKELIEEWETPSANVWVNWEKGDTLFHNDSTTLSQNGGTRIPDGKIVQRSTWHVLAGVTYFFPFGTRKPKYTANLYKVGRKHTVNIEYSSAPDGNPPDDVPIIDGRLYFKKVGMYSN